MSNFFNQLYYHLITLNEASIGSAQIRSDLRREHRKHVYRIITTLIASSEKLNSKFVCDASLA